MRKAIRELAERLKEHGVELTPATIGPDYRFPEPIYLDDDEDDDSGELPKD
ncbi:MAG TPA: hypothetical protein VHG91_20970 [Longimicrobium sp.]|nr:hypothetical protein [Longimicrobium sp.]